MDISDADSEPEPHADDIPNAEEGRRIIELGTRLADQLIEFHGCCRECHEQASQEHEERYEQHYSLQELLSKARDCCPDVLSSNKTASFEDGLHSSMTTAQKRWTFSGIHPRDLTEEPAHICLSRDQTPCQTGRVKFDVDSIVGFCSSLGVAKGGIRWNWMQTPVPPLTSNLHLAKRRVQYSDSHGHLHSVLKPVHEIPHYTLGRFVSFEDISLCLLFPRLYREEQQSSRILDSDFQTLLDRILLPAIYQQHDSGDVQHYPGSYSHAKYNSTARGVEGRSRKVDMMPRQQAIMNFVRPDELHAVWQKIQELIEQPGLQQFKGATILLDAKNLKCLITGRTWKKMIDCLRRYWGMAADESYITSSFFFDVAKETYPFPSYVFHTDTTNLAQPETLFWKRCCLESFYSWIRAGDEAHACQQNIYPTTLLADSVSMAFEPGTRSWLRAAGLIYGQLYNSMKEILAAADQYPFENAAIETLALDPQLRKTWQHVGAGLSHDPIALFKAYLYSKARCHHGLHASNQKSFGVREEYRVSTALLSAITSRFEARDLYDQEHAAPQGEQPYFTYQSAAIMSWVRWNINKFCAGFELVSSLSNQSWVTWEHTRIMLMFLRCLRFSYGGGHLVEAAGLWRDVRHAPSSTRLEGSRRIEGLGFEVTIPQHGYGWFLEKVDWETMTFKAAYSQYMVFNTTSMQTAYHARYSQIRDVQVDFIRVSKIQGLLQQFKDSPQCRDYLQEVLQQLCLCAFRKDVFQHIKGLLKKDMVEKALAGEVALCGPSVKEALRPRHRSLNLVSGKRLAVQSIEVLFAWLWGWKESHFKRKHWEGKPYRLLFQRSFEIIGLMYGKEAAREWRANLRSSFIKSHWLLPYPQGDRFMKSTGKSSVYWWSSYHAGVHAYLESQGAATDVPARRIGHFPLDGWGLSRVPGKYMPYVIQPELHLASLSESEIYEEALRLSLEPRQVADIRPSSREVYCIPLSDPTQRWTASEIEADLVLSKEKLKALRYPRKPRHLDPSSESEQDERESSAEALSDIELTICVQQQEEAIKQEERALEKALARQEAGRVKEVQMRHALINQVLREKREAREKEQEERKRRQEREVERSRAADERRRKKIKRELDAEEEERRLHAEAKRAEAAAKAKLAREVALKERKDREYHMSLSQAMQDAEVLAHIATSATQGGRDEAERQRRGNLIRHRQRERVREVLGELEIITTEYGE
jgi:hypothetical protein